MSDPAAITAAVRDAMSIVDNAIPWQANISRPDLTELRKTALGVILRELPGSMR